MSRRPKYDPASYEPCPVGCGRQRWRGDSLPICGVCQSTVMDMEWLNMRLRLTRDNASLDVLIPFDQALIADCKESLRESISNTPRRRKYQ